MVRMIHIFLDGWAEFKKGFDLAAKEPFNTYDWLEPSHLQKEYDSVKVIVNIFQVGYRCCR